MNISTLNASGESYFACSSDDMILGPGECIDKAPGLNSLHPPFSPRLAAYRWGSRGREAEVNSQRSSGRKSACMNMYVLINLFCFDQPLTIYQPWACISVWMLKVFPACVVMLRRVPQPIIFVSWINSAALCVMDVRNHGRCHGDATLQYSFVALLPADACSSFQAAKKKKKKIHDRGGRGRKRGEERRVEGVCGRIHQNANHPFLTVCPSLCGGDNTLDPQEWIWMHP